MKLGIRLLPLLALVPVAMVGCAANGTDEEVGTNTAAVTAGACSAEHFISPIVAVTGTCYVPPKGPNGKFVVSPLFATTALNTFCEYDWAPYVAGTAPTSADLATLPTTADPDCNVIGPLGVDSDPALMSPLHDATLTQAGATSLPGAPSPVRVAVIDTSPTATKITEGRSPHGYVVERVIREISCPGDGASGPCVGQIEGRLGLPQIDTSHTDVTNGGYFGSQGQLARAIADAVDAWSYRRTHTRYEPTRLVINLSVGWDAGRGYETVGSRMSHPADAVMAALKHASCKGAITIAAAGNKSGTPETTGPMFPAAWETVAAPTKAECEALEGIGYYEERVDAIFPKADVYRPLLWAASGVDGRDRAIATTRVGGVARLVAYADEVVARDGSAFTKNLTGSSMAAAIVSGTAAAAWGYAPHVTPADLMATLYARGADLTKGAPVDVTDKTPGFCLGGACTTMSIRRVSVSNTIAALVPGWISQTVPSYAGNLPKMPGDWSSLDPALFKSSSVDPCKSGVCSLPSASMLTSTAEPWVDPQPGKVGCDVCGLTLTGTLYLIIGGTYTNQPATLQVQTTTGTTQYYQVTPTSTAQSYQLAGITANSQVKTASLSFSSGQLATNEPLMLLK
ncbi:MAG: S8/S53 family peptidase [Polyangiales bacterium]